MQGIIGVNCVPVYKRFADVRSRLRSAGKLTQMRLLHCSSHANWKSNRERQILYTLVLANNNAGIHRVAGLHYRAMRKTPVKPLSTAYITLALCNSDPVPARKQDIGPPERS